MFHGEALQLSMTVVISQQLSLLAIYLCESVKVSSSRLIPKLCRGYSAYMHTMHMHTLDKKLLSFPRCRKSGG